MSERTSYRPGSRPRTRSERSSRPSRRRSATPSPRRTGRGRRGSRRAGRGPPPSGARPRRVGPRGGLRRGPCVEALVATELDTETPGERGLGRASTHPPRFGGAFRDHLRNPAARREFAELIERIVFEAYAGTAAALQSFSEDPVPPRVRPPAEAFEKWVPRMHAGAGGFGLLTLDVLAGATSRTEPRITAAAERHGLLGGLWRAKREHILIQCAGFWIAAGAALCWAPAQP